MLRALRLIETAEILVKEQLFPIHPFGVALHIVKQDLQPELLPKQKKLGIKVAANHGLHQREWPNNEYLVGN
jgi:hypothetical protein